MTNTNKTCRCASTRCMHLIERVRVLDAQTNLNKCVRYYPKDVAHAEAELATALAACPDHGTYRPA